MTTQILEPQVADVPKAKDSYQEFLDSFGLDKLALYDWGISHTVFPSYESVASEWEALRHRIFNNETVYIRRYGWNVAGTQLFQGFYAFLLNNSHVEKDPTNNAAPRKLIQQLTDYRLNDNILNYQVSHIWGRTKNPFLFTAPWNVCYVPKLIDPFTGHESRGVWAKEYQTLLKAEALRRYKPFIDDYNALIGSLNVDEKIEEYRASLTNFPSEKAIARFVIDAKMQLQKIT